MTDRPIIFSAPMVRALLEGRKTQTRRVLKPQPADCWPYTLHMVGQDQTGRWGLYGEGLTRFGDVSVTYAIGDRLWVREAWSPESVDAEEGFYRPDYRATANGQPTDGRWRPSIHMPRWASRLTLTVTEVRVQRLQEISEGDAIAEGIDLDLQCCGNPAIEYDLSDHGEPINPRQGGCCGNPELATDPHQTFADLWTSIHGDAAWDQNPWVTAINFTVEQRNIDA